MIKHLFAIATLGFTLSAYGHDEGHGPKLSDTGKYGGLVAAVVLKADAEKGASAQLIYKSELVRSTDGTTRLYLYDSSMKPLLNKTFDPAATASLTAKVKGKYKTVTFPLQFKSGLFTGKMPNPQAKPYNIDVALKEGGKELLSAFDNLD